jgi:rod shape-determining protein MreC
MRNLLKLLYAYHFFILFLVLEGFSLFLILKGSDFHQARFVQASNSFTSSIYSRVDKIGNYLSLRYTNEMLMAENAELRNKLATFRQIVREKKDSLIDTVSNQRYTYFYAKVVNNSVTKRDNYITINKGSLDGVRRDMGVISKDGIIGFVHSVSDHYAVIISVLNSKTYISAKFKKNNYYGPLTWDGINPKYCQLNELTLSVPIQKGDTIVTSGHTNYYPSDVMIGTVEDFKVVGGNFYKVEVKLNMEFRKLDYVIVVQDIQREERIKLEESITNAK